ncbi:LuxE/PaaK family acyltransferase [Pectobacterium sp. A5351]|uniref:LuxE/PaaK family acyltransferase n=1 Tax=Pectobacterium sp. A5351 TaxID=2914983 RepID=UPI00232BF435|nr:acyl-protein synthetase [Pectobacterium sp. A5351]WCG81853.1 acyl-protein synthetase [Pectobacterium sp. A5351]
MTPFDEILTHLPYSLVLDEKRALMMERLRGLTLHHYEHCAAYRRILDAQGTDVDSLNAIEDIPLLPVSLFKNIDLLSVESEQVVKTMTSSGTTGQRVSKIFLDRNTAANQQKTLVKIVSDYLGATRLPLLIIDSPSVMKDRRLFSARGAGILGFSIFGTDRTYALDDTMALDLPTIRAFIEKHGDKPILLFGFTFMVWQHFYKQLLALGEKLDLSKGILIHGGGWKKLQSEAASPADFSAALHDVCGIPRVHDYYGMVEQTGCIYMQCEAGHLHASIFSDIIIRDHHDFSVCQHGQPGIIQVLSLIPESYPGHSLLTEDQGVILGEDDCTCGRKGKYFKILGRVKNAELRGCSDTYAAQF